MSFEGSANYYRLINEAMRSRLGVLNSADSVLRSLNFATIVEMQTSGRWEPPEPISRRRLREWRMREPTAS